MSLQLKPDVEKYINDEVRAGHYDSPEQVIEAGLAILKQQNGQIDFTEGELNKLLAVGEADIERGDVYDGETVFKELDALSDARRRERSQ